MPIPFVLRFIKDSSNTSKDDVLKITPIDRNVFEWSFKDSNENGSHNLTLQPAYNVSERLDVLLKMVSADAQPPKEIQLDAPGFPSILIKAADLQNNASLIHEALEHVMYMWPEHHCRKHRPLPIYEEDDYADMPPLTSSRKQGTHTFYN